MQVTQYTWGQDSAIQRMDVRQLESGALEAYIHAPSNLGAGALANVPRQLTKNGFSAVIDNVEDAEVLRVGDFKKPEDLVNSLKESGFVSGNAKSAQVGEKEHKPFTEQVRKKTVKLAGVFGIIGHAALGAVGILEKDNKRVATSGFYTAATLTSALYGAGKDGGAGQVIDDMKGYLRKQGVDIPQGDDLTPEELSKKGGVIDTLHGYIKKHPLEIGNTVGLMGNVMLTYSGLRGGDEVQPARTAAGLASMLGALTVILVQEKDKSKEGKFEWPGMENVPGVAAPDLTEAELAHKDENRSLIRKAADFVQERPMRTTGLLSLGGNVAMFADAISMDKKSKTKAASSKQRYEVASDEDKVAIGKEMRRDQLNAKAVGPLAYTTAATYLIATAFTSLSSKTKVSDYDDKEMLGTLCAMSANFIAEQPPEVRNEVIEKSAIYLSKRDDVKESKDEITEILNTKINKLSNSPWTAKVAAERAMMANAPQPEGMQV